jgi:hypothetical protein
MVRRWAVLVLLVTAGCSWLVDVADLDDAVDAGMSRDAGGALDAPVTASEDAGAVDSPDSALDGGGTDADDGAPDALPDVRASLVGEWLFDRDDGGASALDTSGRGHDGALFGAGATGDGGVRGGALFTNDAGGVQVAALGLSAFPTSGTLAMWFRSDSPASDTELRGLFDSWDDTRAHIYLRRVNGAGSFPLQVALQENDGGFAWSHNYELSTGTWIHVALTWDEAARVAVFYVGGTEVGRKAMSQSFEPKQQIVRLGGAFDGAIDEARLFDRALTGPEVADLL